MSTEAQVKEKVQMTSAQKAALGRMRLLDPKLQVRWDHELHVPAHLTGKLAAPVFGANRLLADATIEFLSENNTLFRINNPQAELRAVEQVVDAAGNKCVALQQMYQGIPVEGGTIRVQFDQEKAICRVANKFVPDLDIDTTPDVDAAAAVETALHDAGNGKLEEGFEPQLIIYQRKGECSLAWRIHIDDFANNRDMHYFINAHTGAIIHRYNALPLGHGTGVYSGVGTVVSTSSNSHFILLDNTRSTVGGPAIKTCDMAGSYNSCNDTYLSEDDNDDWADITNSPRYKHQGAEVDVHRYMGEIVDYFRTHHSWNSFDGAGAIIYSGVHRGSNYNNAFYRPSEKRFYFGDGDNTFFGYLTARDIIAHEFTHGVTAHTSRLGYPDDQPGGLNEAFSDIFAAFVDSNDTDIGEEVTTPAIWGDCLRRMNNPADPSLGANFRIPNHCDATLDTLGIGYEDTLYDGLGNLITGDPHVNCGPIIYAAFFMLMGGTHPNSHITVDAIGYTKTSQIFWHIQHVGLLNNPTATFLECREAAVNAVNTLFKSDPDYLRLLDSAKNAFTAVGIGPDIYVRDSLSDTGAVPSVGTLYMSPDIITRTAKVINPAVVLGDMNNADLSEDIEHGQPNYVYVRLQNRGIETGDVTVRLYWSAPTTFGDPSQWHLIGLDTAYLVQPGHVSFLEFVWSAAALPPLGHFCLVCELDDPLDPAPDKSLITNGSLYSKFIAESNNFAWKNINVVDVLPAGLTGMEFTIHGNANEYAEIEINLEQLPVGTEAHLRVLRRLCEGTQFVNMAFEKMNTRYSYYTLTAGQMCRLRDIPFQNNDSSSVNIYLRMPNTTATYLVPVVQHINGRIVGRVTGVFNVLNENDLAFIGNRNSTEVHKKGCEWINRMSSGNKIGFRTLTHAHLEGYDNCAYCLGDSTR